MPTVTRSVRTFRKSNSDGRSVVPTVRPSGTGGSFCIDATACGKSAATSTAIGLRVIFCMGEGHMILLHGFIKKTQKTPQADIARALKRKREVT